ncbi:MAG: hypothetical protein WAU02_00445 [Candidatus Saccharimonadales bacterium]
MTAAVQTAPVDTSTAPAMPSPESVSPKPSKSVVLDLIMAEAGCTRSNAGNVLKWIDGLVKRARAARYGLVYPTAEELRSRNYAIFDQIMPHGEASKPGSAHEAVERFLLNPSRDEIGLIHDMTDTPDNPSYCTVRVSLGVMR